MKLQGQPVQILEILLEKPGQLVTREELREQLWTSDTFVDFDHSLNTAIKKLRQALGDEADTPHYIETLPRRGYRFIGDVNAEDSLHKHPGPELLADDVNGNVAPTLADAAITATNFGCRARGSARIATLSTALLLAAAAAY